MHLEKYNISRSGSLPEIWPKTAPTTKIATPKSPNTAPVTKNNTPKSPNGARTIESDSPTSPNVVPATKKWHRFLSWLLLYCSFPDWPAPFLNYSIPFLNLSFTEYSFTGHFLDWTIPFWTVPLLSLPLMNYTFTALFFYRTIPLLN